MTDDRAHVFQANAVSQNSDLTGYPAGEKHAMLVFLRQPEEEHDWQKAEKRAHSSGWEHVEFRRAGTLGEAFDHLEETMRKAADSAMSDGSSIVVYADKLSWLAAKQEIAAKKFAMRNLAAGVGQPRSTGKIGEGQLSRIFLSQRSHEVFAVKQRRPLPASRPPNHNSIASAVS